MAMGTKKKEESFSLVVGSSYLVRSAESREKPMETRGKLRGFASIGQETAIAMEMDESHGDGAGKLRFIPLNVILSIDVLKSVEKQEEKKEQQPEGVYFG
jgi:hypothetical protein